MRGIWISYRQHIFLRNSSGFIKTGCYIQSYLYSIQLLNEVLVSSAFLPWTGLLCLCTCLQNKELNWIMKPRLMSEFQFLFSVAASVITLIKPAESIITELKVIIWLHCQLKKHWVKDFNWVKSIVMFCIHSKNIQPHRDCDWLTSSPASQSKAPMHFFWNTMFRSNSTNSYIL